MAARARVPVLLLSGFLGAGKTTLLARWLRAPEFSGAVAIVNELGEVGLDDRLVATANDSPILLENGCVCCAARDDLAAALEALFWDRLHRKIPPFTWVLIETTGIAEPGAVRDALAGNDVVAERYEIAGVLSVFDVRRGPALAALHAECEAQARDADALVLTKTDLADEADLAAARACLARLNPDAPTFVSVRGDLPASVALAALGGQGGPIPDRAGVCGHDHSHERAHACDLRHASHTGDVSAAFLPLESAVAAQALEAAVAAAFSQFGSQLLRVKGAARFLDGAGLEIVQADPAAPLERTPWLAPEGAKPPRPGLTLIARGRPAAEAADIVAAALAAPVALASPVAVRIAP